MSDPSDAATAAEIRAETIKEVVVALRERANPGIVYDWAWPAADFIEREFKWSTPSRTRRIA